MADVSPEMVEAAKVAAGRVLRRYRLPEHYRDDLVNAALWEQWKALPRRDPTRSTLRTFLHGCATNGALNCAERVAMRWEKRRREGDAPLETLPAPGTVDSVWADRLQVVEEALSEMPLKYRLAINRRFRERVGVAEIAAELGLDQPQTWNVLRKAMKRLRELIARREKRAAVGQTGR